MQARENLVAFIGLLGKLVPSQIAAEVTQSVATVTDDIMTPADISAAQNLARECLKKNYKGC